MPTYMVEVQETRTYRKRVEADSPKAAQDAEWEPLEEVNPEEVGYELWEAEIDSVTARTLRDWEKVK